MARARNAILVTTEKDAIRVSNRVGLARSDEHASQSTSIFDVSLRELPVRLRTTNETELQKLVASALFVRRSVGARPAHG